MKNCAFLSALLVLWSLSFSASAQFRFPNLKSIKLPTGVKPPTGSPGSQGVGGLSGAEAANGLKEALMQGIGKGADQASQTDGFYLNRLIRIPFRLMPSAWPPPCAALAWAARSTSLSCR